MNVDDRARPAARSTPRPSRSTPYSLADADDLERRRRRQPASAGGASRCALPLGGRFNVANALAAATAAARARHRRRRPSPPGSAARRRCRAGSSRSTPASRFARPRRLRPHARRAWPGCWPRPASGHRRARHRGVRLRRRPRRGQAPAHGRGGGRAGRRGRRHLGQPPERGPGAIIEAVVAGVPAPRRGAVVVEPDRRAAIALGAGRRRSGRRRRDRRQGPRDDPDDRRPAPAVRRPGGGPASCWRRRR